MNCLECAKADRAVPAVGICSHCGAGLCLDHLIEAHGYRVGGTLFGCPHRLPTARTLHDVSAGVAAGGRRHTAAAK